MIIRKMTGKMGTKHAGKLTKHNLIATGTTGKLIEEDLGVEVKRVMSGPLGGDQQLGS